MPDRNDPTQHQFWRLLSKKLAKEITAEELAELQSILLSNPELHHQTEMLAEMWQQKAKNSGLNNEAAYMRHIMKHKGEFFVEEIFEESNAENFSEADPGFLQRIFSKKKLTLFLFLGFFLLASCAIYLFTQTSDAKLPPEQAISSIVTKNGNRSKVVLPDGSHVWLNAGSSLDYNISVFNKNSREVTLNGEAYFDVTKNPEKPFIIHTKKMDIKVIGTAFNIRSYNDEKTAEASLIKGTLEVTLKDRNGQKVLLNPNEKISIAMQEGNADLSKPVKTPAIESNKPIPQFVVNELKPSPV
ncbi:MAG TPA: FecR family protein, partial [Chitinophagaceae bacterium]